MKNSGMRITKAFRPSIDPTPDSMPEPTPAMLLTQKIPELVDPSRGMRYREIKLRDGRSKNEAITTQDELIEELTRQLKYQEQRAADPSVDESFRVAYRKNIETLQRALLEANSALNMTQQATGVGISGFFSNLFSFFSDNVGQKQTVSNTSADLGQKQKMEPNQH